MKQKAPVLLIIFYRPDLTARVFDAIKKYQPEELFIAADGPRNEQEALICAETRNIVEDIHWNCNVHRLYHHENLGCKVAVTKAITWFFDHVEEGIILEDDCLPHPDFFGFCENMLSLYRHDHSVGLISGSNFASMVEQKEYNHYLSPVAYIWGWASWRRFWKKYNSDPITLNNFNWKSLPGNHIFQRMFWYIKLCRVHWGEINTWDYQLQYALSASKQSAVIPTVNLIENIGFDDRATHTLEGGPQMSVFPISSNPHICFPQKDSQALIEISINRLTKKNPILTLVRFLYCKIRLILNN
jgi:hypothetical protein